MQTFYAGGSYRSVGDEWIISGKTMDNFSVHGLLAFTITVSRKQRDIYCGSTETRRPMIPETKTISFNYV